MPAPRRWSLPTTRTRRMSLHNREMLRTASRTWRNWFVDLRCIFLPHHAGASELHAQLATVAIMVTPTGHTSKGSSPLPTLLFPIRFCIQCAARHSKENQHRQQVCTKGKPSRTRVDVLTRPSPASCLLWCAVCVQQIHAEDEETLQKFMQTPGGTARPQQIRLADLIMEKITEKQTELASQMSGNTDNVTYATP